MHGVTNTDELTVHGTFLFFLSKLNSNDLKKKLGGNSQSHEETDANSINVLIYHLSISKESDLRLLKGGEEKGLTEKQEH